VKICHNFKHKMMFLTWGKVADLCVLSYLITINRYTEF
jgi:hypothetical protein